MEARNPSPAPGSPVLAVEDLRVGFATPHGRVSALRGVSLNVDAGEVVALVGESGSGKSVTALAAMGLIRPPKGFVEGGRIAFCGEDITAYGPRKMRRLRGDRMGMIFQDPMTSLDPAFTIGDQMVEALRTHRNVSVAEARQRALALLDRVRIPDAKRRLSSFPHELSGGQRQRVMIAIALLCDPVLLIADEPTTALDATVQKEVLDLITELQRELGIAVLLITHDFGVVRRIAHRVVVMYGGLVMEAGPIEGVVENPAHPYTRALWAARPRIGERGVLPTIPGSPPNLANHLPGCPFANRYDADPACWLDLPPMVEIGESHWVRWSGEARS